MTLKYGSATSTLELDAMGKRAGFFDLTHSDDRYAFSAIRSPLGVIRGGEGPTALVCAGNHGDEYEGQIIARRLYHRLNASDLKGRLILAPALNMPAVLTSSRVSPLDGGNLNRSFPGAAFATPTQEIAGFVATQLMPLADIAIDLHSGGTGADYIDCAYFCLSPDRARNFQTRELANAMGLANTMVVPADDTPGDFDGSAHAAGCAMLSCELGGEGKIALRSLEAGWRGVLRVLVHSGVLMERAAKRLGMTPTTGTRFLDMGAKAEYITAQTHGLWEPLVAIDATVHAGQTLALMHNTYRLDAAPQELCATSDGIVVIRRATPIVAPGDHLFVVSSVITDAGLDAILAEQGA